MPNKFNDELAQEETDRKCLLVRKGTFQTVLERPEGPKSPNVQWQRCPLFPTTDFSAKSQINEVYIDKT